MAVDTVVFLTGICGSVLRDGQRTIWSGTPENALFNTYPDEYVDTLATRVTLTAPDVLRSVPLTVFGLPIYHVDGYGRALQALEGMRFQEAADSLVPFAYGWPRDVRTSTAELHKRLSQSDLGGKRTALLFTVRPSRGATAGDQATVLVIN